MPTKGALTLDEFIPLYEHSLTSQRSRTKSTESRIFVGCIAGQRSPCTSLTSTGVGASVVDLPAVRAAALQCCIAMMTDGGCSLSTSARLRHNTTMQPTSGTHGVVLIEGPIRAACG